MKRSLVLLILTAGLLVSQPAGLRSQNEGDELNSRIMIGAIAWDDGWNRFLRSPSSCFFDESAGELFVTDLGNNRVIIYDRDLIPKYTFAHFVRDRSSDRIVAGEPRDLVVTSRGEIILIDNYVDYLELLDFRGTPLERIYLNSVLGDTTLTVKAQCITIDAHDNLYIGTAGDLVGVVVLDDRLQFQRFIEGKNAGGSDFNTILTVHVWDSLLFVTDLYSKPAVKIFDTTGTYLRGFGAHDIEESDMSFPSGLSVMTDRTTGRVSIWIADGLRQVVKVFHLDGRFLAHVGGFGVNLGEFRYPGGLATSGDSVVYVVERVGNRIQKFVIQ